MKTHVALFVVAAAAAVGLCDGSSGFEHQDPRLIDVKKQDIRDILLASKRILNYFEAYMEHMNVDAVLGSKMAEDQYAVVLANLDQSPIATYDAEAMDFLRQLLVDIRAFNRKAIDDAKNKYPPDFVTSFGNFFKPSLFEVPLAKLHLDNSSLQFKEFNRDLVLQGNEQLSEDKSDACLGDILSTGKSSDSILHHGGYVRHKKGIESDISRSQCLVSEECWSTMTEKGYSGYSLTHQLFYIIIAMQTGCISELNNMISRTGGAPLEEVIKDHCSNMLMEAQAIAEAGFPGLRKDLLMEQGIFCGLLGYDNFFPRSWLRQVLSWQRDIGCYGDTELFQEMLQDHKKSKHHRSKRAEKSMPGRCMSHFSAMGIGYLAVALRYLIF